LGETVCFVSEKVLITSNELLLVLRELILDEQEVRVCYNQRVVEDMVVVSIDLEDNLY
jgi:hypothetical protein